MDKSKKLKHISIYIVFITCLMVVSVTMVTYSALQSSKRAVGSIEFDFNDIEGQINVNCYIGTERVALKDVNGMSDVVIEKTTNSINPLLVEDSMIVLTAKNSYVVFEYIFKNNSSDESFHAILNQENDDSMITYKYTCQSKLSNPYENELWQNTNQSSEIVNIEVAKGQTQYVYIKYEIAHLYESLDFDLNIACTLKSSDIVI